MRILVRLGVVAVLLAGFAAAWLLGRPSGMAFHATTAETWLSGLVIVAALGGVALTFARAVTARLAIAIVLFAAGDALLLSRALDRWPLEADLFHSPRYVWFLVGVLSATTYGLVRRRLWARWLGLAFGSYGALSAGINAVAFLRMANPVDNHWTWAFVAFSLGSLMIGLHLADPDLADAFLARSGQAGLWGSTDNLVRVGRWAMISSFAAVSMLLVYAWMQPFVPSTARSAELLAVVLALGAILTALRKVAGGLVLGLGGLGLAAQCAITATRGAAQPDFVAYYLVFWVPAATLGIVYATMIVWRASRARLA